jgi:hypothetical protein
MTNDISELTELPTDIAKDFNVTDPNIDPIERGFRIANALTAIKTWKSWSAKSRGK